MLVGGELEDIAAPVSHKAMHDFDYSPAHTS